MYVNLVKRYTYKDYIGSHMVRLVFVNVKLIFPPLAEINLSPFSLLLDISIIKSGIKYSLK